MPTIKERIWLLYNSDSLLKTYLGLAVKFGAEWVGWALILGPIILGGSLLFPSIRLTATLTENSAVAIWLGLTTPATYGTWCYASDDPES